MTDVQIAPDPLTTSPPRSPRATVLSGSPSATSRTATVARLAANALAGSATVHLGDLSAEALLGRTLDAAVDDALATLRAAEVLVVATPVYRATYTALTKSIFDLLPSGALAGTVVVPIATGATRDHSLAIDHGLRPLVASLGAWTTPTGVFASHADFDDDGVPLARLVDAVHRAVDQAVALVRAHGEIR